MLQLSRVVTLGAYNRNESRGAHYKPDFPDRNDEEFLKQQWHLSLIRKRLLLSIMKR